MAPNLFEYATTELAQDAVVCWLLAWADHKCQREDPVLHGIGNSLVTEMLKLHGVTCPQPMAVTVHRQLLHTDIVAEIGSELVLLIEDKVHAGLHGDQLTRYQKEISAKYHGKRVLSVFLKTGDQSTYAEPENAGYEPFLRSHLLDLFRPWKQKTSNAIFVDFLQNLEWREKQIESYATMPVSEWTKEWDPWIGFYKRLQQEISGSVTWGYVSNARGGFLGAWWNFIDWRDPNSDITHEVYLQIEQGPLCFKIAAADEEADRNALWERWYSKLSTTAGELGFAVNRPRRRSGAFMTVARVELEGWIGKTSDGSLDIAGTINFLQSAALLLDRAAQNVEPPPAAGTK